MKLTWTYQASADVIRVHDFLTEANPRAAVRVTRLLITAPERLLAAPRLGQRVERDGSEEVRRLIVGNYELRYEVRDQEVLVLRIWHTREKR